MDMVHFIYSSCSEKRSDITKEDSLQPKLINYEFSDCLNEDLLDATKEIRRSRIESLGEVKTERLEPLKGDTKFELDTNLITSRDSQTGELLVEVCGHKYPIDSVSSEKHDVVFIDDCEELDYADKFVEQLKQPYSSPSIFPASSQSFGELIDNLLLTPEQMDISGIDDDSCKENATNKSQAKTYINLEPAKYPTMPSTAQTYNVNTVLDSTAVLECEEVFPATPDNRNHLDTQAASWSYLNSLLCDSPPPYPVHYKAELNPSTATNGSCQLTTKHTTTLYNHHATSEITISDFPSSDTLVSSTSLPSFAHVASSLKLAIPDSQRLSPFSQLSPSSSKSVSPIPSTFDSDSTTEYSDTDDTDSIDSDQVMTDTKRKKSKSSKLKRSCRIWEFIRDLLLDPEYNPSIIRWEDREEGTFKLVQSKTIAYIWGAKKGNKDMTYEKFSRAMSIRKIVYDVNNVWEEFRVNRIEKVNLACTIINAKFLNLWSGNVLCTSSAPKLMAGENDRTWKAMTTCHSFVFGKRTVYLFASSAHGPLLREWITGENFLVLTNTALVREPMLWEVCLL